MCDARGLDLVLEREKAAAKRCVSDPSARVDARPEHEAEVVRGGRLGEAGGIEKGRQPDVAAAAHHLQALDHIGAVEAGKRHHVADRRQRYQIEQAEQVGRRPRGGVVSRAGAAHVRRRPAP